MRRHLLALPVAGLLAASLMGAHAPVNAKSESPSDYLKKHPKVTVVDDAVRSVPGAVVVDGTGQVVEQISENPSAAAKTTSSSDLSSTAAAACGYINASFVTRTWKESGNGCGIIGWDSTARYQYKWFQDILLWNSGPSCVQGRSYSTNINVREPVWVTAGCGSSGGTSAYIGNRATVAKIRGQIVAVGTVGYVRWL